MIALIVATVIRVQAQALPPAQFKCGSPRPLATDSTQTVRVCERTVAK